MDQVTRVSIAALLLSLFAAACGGSPEGSGDPSASTALSVTVVDTAFGECGCTMTGSSGDSATFQCAVPSLPTCTCTGAMANASSVMDQCCTACRIADQLPSGGSFH